MRAKDYRLIAKALADEEPIAVIRDDIFHARYAVWTSMVLTFADALADDSGYDLNGNRRFDRDRFLASAGMPAKVAR